LKTLKQVAWIAKVPRKTTVEKFRITQVCPIVQMPNLAAAVMHGGQNCLIQRELKALWMRFETLKESISYLPVLEKRLSLFRFFS
jgi:hypothetical protein